MAGDQLCRGLIAASTLRRSGELETPWLSINSWKSTMQGGSWSNSQGGCQQSYIHSMQAGMIQELSNGSAPVVQPRWPPRLYLHNSVGQGFAKNPQCATHGKDKGNVAILGALFERDITVVNHFHYLIAVDYHLERNTSIHTRQKTDRPARSIREVGR